MNRERQMQDAENQLIAAMEGQMSELSGSNMLHSAPESYDNRNEESERQNENNSGINYLE